MCAFGMCVCVCFHTSESKGRGMQHASRGLLDTLGWGVWCCVRVSTERNDTVRLPVHQDMPRGAASRHAGNQIRLWAPVCSQHSEQPKGERLWGGGCRRCWDNAGCVVGLPTSGTPRFAGRYLVVCCIWLCIEETAQSIILCCAAQPRPRGPFSQTPAARFFLCQHVLLSAARRMYSACAG